MNEEWTTYQITLITIAILSLLVATIVMIYGNGLYKNKTTSSQVLVTPDTNRSFKFKWPIYQAIIIIAILSLLVIITATIHGSNSDKGKLPPPITIKQDTNKSMQFEITSVPVIQDDKIIKEVFQENKSFLRSKKYMKIIEAPSTLTSIESGFELYIKFHTATLVESINDFRIVIIENKSYKKISDISYDLMMHFNTKIYQKNSPILKFNVLENFDNGDYFIFFGFNLRKDTDKLYYNIHQLKVIH